MEKSNLKVLLDAGHGANTPGKRSPDGKLLEWQYNRTIVNAIAQRLTELNIDYAIIHQEDNEIGGTSHDLNLRTSRANTICTSTKQHCIYVSVHVNAAGNGDWNKATGWAVYTSKGFTKADVLAECMAKAAEEVLKPFKKKVRKDMTDGDMDYEENFYVLKHTMMPAVLTENFFMDNKEDVEWLLSPKGIVAITDIHVKGILNYIKEN